MDDSGEGNEKISSIFIIVTTCLIASLILNISLTVMIVSHPHKSECVLYGSLTNGGHGYGVMDNGTPIEGSLFNSFNGGDTINKFNSLYKNFSDARRICFEPYLRQCIY